MANDGEGEYSGQRFGATHPLETESGMNAASRRRWTNRLAIIFVVLVALGPVVYLEGPAEVARWYQAAATELWLAGDKAAALARLDTAIHWAPDQADGFVCRADWRLEDREFLKASEDYSVAIERDPAHAGALIGRSQAYQYLGRHQDAIQDWKRLLELGRAAPGRQRAVLLNGLAYAQALGNVELKEALENILQAINLAGENSAMLDTRGYIHYCAGKYQLAQPDLDLAVAGMEREVKMMETTRDYVDQREFERQLRETRKSLAVIRYHRALLLEKLGKPKEAESDLRRVRELGYEPNPNLF